MAKKKYELYQAKILEVSEVWEGSELTSDVALGATVLPVYNAADFEDDGGQVEIEGTVYGYLTKDDDASTITLATPLVSAKPEDTQIYVYPVSIDKRAMCQIDPGEDSVPARIPHALRGAIEDLIREEIDSETALLKWEDDEWVIEDLIGVEYRITTESVQNDPESPLTDGEAPAASPTPRVIGGAGYLLASVVPFDNADALSYKWYLGVVPDFTPNDSVNLVDIGPQTRITIRELPNPTSNPDLETALQYDTIYYVKVIAFDEDGAAPASPAGQGALVRTDGSEINPDSVTALQIRTKSLTGDLFEGTMILGGVISSGNLNENGELVGARVDLGADGLGVFKSTGERKFWVPTSDQDDAYLRAHVELLSARFLGGASFESLNSEFAADSQVTLSKGISTPISPLQIEDNWDTIQLDTLTQANRPDMINGSLGTFALNPSQIRSMAWDATWSKFVVLQQRGNGFRWWRFNANGSLFYTDGYPSITDYPNRTNGTGGVVYPGALGPSVMHDDASGTWWIWGHTSASVGAINRIPPAWIVNPDQPPYLGFDYVNNQYILAQNYNEGTHDEVYVRRFHLVTTYGANAVSDGVVSFDVGTGRGGRIIGMTYGSQPVAGTRFQWAVETSQLAFAASAAGVEDLTYRFDMANLMAALFHDGVNYWSCDSNGRLYKYENNHPGAQSQNIWSAYSLYDSDTGGTGEHETPVGPIALHVQKRRAKIKWTFPEVPDRGGADDPDKWRLYALRSLIPPSANLLRRQAEGGSSTVRTTHIRLNLSTDTAVANSGTPPGFPDADPAVLRSAKTNDSLMPMIYLDGAGDYYLDPDSNLDDTDWVTLDSGAGEVEFNTSVEDQFRYRRIGKDMTVEIVKATVVARDSSGSTSGDFVNRRVTAMGALPEFDAIGHALRPSGFGGVPGVCYLNHAPVTCVLNSAGTITWIGGLPTNYPVGSLFNAIFKYTLD